MNTPNTDRSTQQQQQQGDKPQSPGRGAPGTDQPKDRGAYPDRDPNPGGHGAGQTDEAAVTMHSGASDQP